VRRAFVPLVHLSDAGGRKGKAKWKVGQEVAARVLEANAATKRTTATLKKALVASKLPLIVHLQVGLTHMAISMRSVIFRKFKRLKFGQLAKHTAKLHPAKPTEHCLFMFCTQNDAPHLGLLKPLGRLPCAF
jgi:hypothetical protein